LKYGRQQNSAEPWQRGPAVNMCAGRFYLDEINIFDLLTPSSPRMKQAALVLPCHIQGIALFFKKSFFAGFSPNLLLYYFMDKK
jgi:hypothetical protein